MAYSMITPKPEQLLSEAHAALLASRWSEAIILCRQVLANDPDNLEAHSLWALAQLPGPDYYEMLKRIHRHLRPATYVEIGIDKGSTIAVAALGTRIVGIDPDPQLSRPLPESVRIFRETSDEFFAKHDLCEELGGRPVDLALIDGMHLFEFALRDFINIERCCTAASTCLVHDCYPLDEPTSGRDRVTQFWTGDVWKLILCLRKYRPDLDVHTVATPPTGLAVIRCLDPTSRVLVDRLDSMCDEFMALPYSAVHGDKRGQLNLVSNNWLSVKPLFKAADAGPAS